MLVANSPASYGCFVPARMTWGTMFLWPPLFRRPQCECTAYALLGHTWPFATARRVGNWKRLTTGFAISSQGCDSWYLHSCTTQGHRSVRHLAPSALKNWWWDLPSWTCVVPDIRSVFHVVNILGFLYATVMILLVQPGTAYSANFEYGVVGIHGCAGLSQHHV